MLAAGRLADIFGARLVPIGLVAFGLAAALPALAHSVGALAALLVLVGVTTGVLDIAINAEAARIEAEHRVRVMDGLHAMFSVGVLVGGAGSGFLRRAGAQPSWILGGIGAVIAVSAMANRSSGRPVTHAPRRAPLRRGLLIVGGVLFSWLLGKPVSVKPHPVSKANTAAQLLLVGLVLAALGFGFDAGWALALTMAAVAALTLASVAVYLREWVLHMGANGIKR